MHKTCKNVNNQKFNYKVSVSEHLRLKLQFARNYLQINKNKKHRNINQMQGIKRSNYVYTFFFTVH